MYSQENFQLVPTQLSSILLIIEQFIDKREIFITKKITEYKCSLLEIAVKGTPIYPRILIKTSSKDIKFLVIPYNSNLLFQDYGDRKCIFIKCPDFKIPTTRKKDNGLTTISDEFKNGEQWKISTTESYYYSM